MEREEEKWVVEEEKRMVAEEGRKEVMGGDAEGMVVV